MDAGLNIMGWTIADSAKCGAGGGGDIHVHVVIPQFSFKYVRGEGINISVFFLLSSIVRMHAITHLTNRSATSIAPTRST